MLILFAACTQPGDLTGQLVDARTERPIGQVAVTATVTDAGADPACRVREAVTDTDGAFRVTGLCPGERYRLTPSDPTWWVPEPPEAAGNVATTGVTLAAWRAPVDDGVYLLTEDRLEPLPTNTTLDPWILPDGHTVVSIPLAVPVRPPTVTGDDVLVVVGQALVQSLGLAPLVASTRETSGRASGPSPSPPRPFDAWYTVGARITPTDEVEPISTVQDPVGQEDVHDTTRRVRYLDDRALPAGTYALRDPAVRDAWILTFSPGASRPAASNAGAAAP